MKTLKKIRQLSWIQLYKDNCLKWETILSKQPKTGERIYSFRFSKNIEPQLVEHESA